MEAVQARKQRMISGALTDQEVRTARIEELKMLFTQTSAEIRAVPSLDIFLWEFSLALRALEIKVLMPAALELEGSLLEAIYIVFNSVLAEADRRLIWVF